MSWSDTIREIGKREQEKQTKHEEQLKIATDALDVSKHSNEDLLALYEQTYSHTGCFYPKEREQWTRALNKIRAEVLARMRPSP